MEILKNIGVVVLIIITYFVLQIIGSFIEFGIFGSGAGIEGYELYIPIIMVIIQVIITSIIKLKTSFLKNSLLYMCSILIPIGLFAYYYFLIPN